MPACIHPTTSAPPIHNPQSTIQPRPTDRPTHQPIIHATPTPSKKHTRTQNSNLVLEADREARRAAGEATGEVETWDERKLAGKRMGDRVVGRTRAPEVEDRLKKAKEK